MEQMKIAAQLYSFRDYIKTPAGVRDTLRRLRQIGFSAVQLSSSIAPMPEEELRRISGLGLRFCHPSRFLITADDREQAVEACRHALRAAGRPVSE